MNSEIWIEKYRPNVLSEIIGQDKIVNKLKDYVTSKNMSHLLFSGSPGTGKTTASIVLAKELYGRDWRSNFKELNSSDQRGIDVIRGIVKEYASVKSIGNIEFKIILLDEADSLTSDAQSALRRTMEKFSGSCRFILSCNYSSKIIDPIQSRCSVFRFKRLGREDIIKQCKYICDTEGVKYENEALDAIAYNSEGDMRKSIGILEAASLSSDMIKVCDIYDIVGMVEPGIVKSIIVKALSRDFFGALTIIEKLVLDGLSSYDILKGMMKEVMDLGISDKMKVDIVDRIGEADFRISEGANEMIQMKWLVASMVRLGSAI